MGNCMYAKFLFLSYLVNIRGYETNILVKDCYGVVRERLGVKDGMKIKIGGSSVKEGRSREVLHGYRIEKSRN